ncbi:MAG: type II toxin-antitoxin system RelE/ParE family toxin [Desulfobacteria bacterium]
MPGSRRRAGWPSRTSRNRVDWKPMPSVGQGVSEIRIHTRVEHRVFYIAKFSEGIYVLHAFQKRTRKTSKTDIDLARRRHGQLIRDRQDL